MNYSVKFWPDGYGELFRWDRPVIEQAVRIPPKVHYFVNTDGPVRSSEAVGDVYELRRKRGAMVDVFLTYEHENLFLQHTAVVPNYSSYTYRRMRERLQERGLPADDYSDDVVCSTFMAVCINPWEEVSEWKPAYGLVDPIFERHKYARVYERMYNLGVFE